MCLLSQDCSGKWRALLSLRIQDYKQSKCSGASDHSVVQKPNKAQALYKERWQKESAFYGKQIVMQS
jgi:hypothetical protein